MSWSSSASFAKIDLPGPGVRHHLASRALDHHLAEVQHGDALGEVQRHVHVVLDHHAPPLPVGRVREGPLRQVLEPDAGQRFARPADQRRLSLQAGDRVPAQRRAPEERERDVPQQRLAREQRDDLVGSGDPEMRSVPARDPRDVPAEERDRPAVGPELAGHQVEERRLARAVRADDQAPLPCLHREIHRGGDEQAAEGLRQALHGQRDRWPDHWAGPSPGAATAATARVAGRAVARRHSRATPGTSPSGMKTTIATKMAPSTKFQRSMYALATFFMTTTSAAPTTGPSSVPLPPEMTIRSASAEAVSATACGLTNWL